MKWIAVLIGLAGCWQMTVYAGPRIDGDGVVGVELGASLGAAAPIKSSAITTSIDSSAVFPRPHRTSTAARALVQQPAQVKEPVGMIRGVVEFTDSPVASGAFLRTPGLGWRAGFYGGAAFHADQTAVPLVGVQAALSPFVWGLDDAHSKQFIALGVQLGTEAVFGDEIFVVRAALTLDGQFLPRRW